MLSLDRYDAVINPLVHTFNTRDRAKHMVFIAWFLSGLLSIPAIFLNQIRIKNNLPQCWTELSASEWRLYFTLVSLSLFFVPALVIFYCYICIIRTIWFNQRRTEQTITTTSTTSSSNDRCVKQADIDIEQEDVYDQFDSNKEKFLSNHLHRDQQQSNKQRNHSSFLNNDQLLKSDHRFTIKDQFTSDESFEKETNKIKDQSNCSTISTKTTNDMKDQFTTKTTVTKNSNNHSTIKPEFRDHLGMKLNSITAQSSMWPNNGINHTTNCNQTNDQDRYNDKLNDTLLDKSSSKIVTRSISNNNRSPMFYTSKKSILQKHRSFDQAFDRTFDRSFDRIQMNPRLNSICEQNLKINLLDHNKKNSFMRVNSQGIIPKARIKTLQMTCVIITGELLIRKS